MSSVIEVMARGIFDNFYLGSSGLDDMAEAMAPSMAEAALSALHSAGYQLARPGECVVSRKDLNSAVDFLRMDSVYELADKLELAASPRQASPHPKDQAEDV